VVRPVVLGTLAGAVAGTIGGLALVALLPRGSEQGFFLAGIGLAGWHWLLPALIPAAAGAVAWAAGGLVAGRGLRRWS
jgi:cell division transport system permease protein